MLIPFSSKILNFMTKQKGNYCNVKIQPVTDCLKAEFNSK